ncbi:MAG TPA: hypothetical protein VM287_00990 [Egibacteraceae bacterium]|nr:hypothetical protein [Egibacteraceae bacterium]
MSDTAVLMRLEPVREALAELRQLDAVGRLHHRDPALWSTSPGVQQGIIERLGWLDVVGGHDEWREALPVFVEQARADRLHHVLLVGMGGSSLAPELFARTFAGRAAGAQMAILDSTHPAAVSAALDDPDLSTTLVIVSSKSGATEETRALAAQAAGLVPGPHHLVAVTDAGSELDDRASDQGWRAVWRNRSDIGGRYSALSLFGMLPAALVGVDIDAVWASGAAMAARCGPQGAVDDNPAAQLAAFMAGLAASGLGGPGRNKLTLLLPEPLASLGDWIEQLVAESTGKNGVGVVPVVGEPLGPPEVYGEDRAFVAYRLGGKGPDTTALTAAGHPVLTLDLDDPLEVGGAFVLWEIATALAGALLGVNPFDEPNVAESKDNTRAVLAEFAADELPEPEQGDVAALLGTLEAGDYFSLQAYLPPSAEYGAPLARVREIVRDRCRVATTAGWGPRFLHSTGQLHKGGPNTVVALQIVDVPRDGPDIPERDYDFANLVRAQALGDLRSLRDHGRRVTQYAVTGPEDLARLADEIEAALD